LRKGKEKKVNLGWHRDKKENPVSAPSIHVAALVGAGSLWPRLLTPPTSHNLEKTDQAASVGSYDERCGADNEISVR
jgi:hypothetical protein